MKRTKKATKKIAKKSSKKPVKKVAKKSVIKKKTGKVVKKKVTKKKVTKKVLGKKTGKISAKKKVTKKNVAKKSPTKKLATQKPTKVTETSKQHALLGKQVPAVSVHVVQVGVPSKIVNLQDLVATDLSVLYFYPKDDTPGCTTEACEFGDRLQDFIGLGAQVIGVSPDNEGSHLKFIEKYKIPFALISDVEQELCKKMNLWNEKTFMGKKYMGVERATFLLKDGYVVYAWQPVKVEGHVAAVHQKLSELKG